MIDVSPADFADKRGDELLQSHRCPHAIRGFQHSYEFAHSLKSAEKINTYLLQSSADRTLMTRRSVVLISLMEMVSGCTKKSRFVCQLTDEPGTILKLVVLSE